MKELLSKFNETPGYCTIDELLKINDFLKGLIHPFEIFWNFLGYNPIGYTLEAKIEKCEWYIKRHQGF